MNELEIILSEENNESLSAYLGDVTCGDFRKHINEIIAKYSDKGAIKQAIESLQKLL